MLKSVEEVGAGAENLFLSPDVEVLEQRQVDMAIGGSALGTVACGSELKHAFIAIGTGSVIGKARPRGRCQTSG